MIPHSALKWLLKKAGVSSLEELPEEEYPAEYTPGVFTHKNPDGSTYVTGPGVDELYNAPDLPDDPPLNATFQKLPNGSWGAMVVHGHSDIEKHLLTIISGQGQQTKARVKKVVKTAMRIDGMTDCLCEYIKLK